MAIQDIPPDLLDLLAQFQTGGEAALAQPIYKSRLEDAQAMRDTAMPQATRALGQDKFGTIIGATNPLEYVNAAARQIMGGQDVRDIQAQMMQGVGQEGAGYRAAILAKLLREYPGKEAAPAAPTMDPVDRIGGGRGYVIPPLAVPTPPVRKKKAPPPVASAAPAAAPTGVTAADFITGGDPTTSGITGGW